MKRIFSFYNLILAIFSLFIVLPVLYTFFSAIFFNNSLNDDLSGLDISSFILLAKSVLISAFIALISTIIGTVLAFILYKTRIKYSGFLKIIVLMPLFISPYILAVAWRDFFFIAFENLNLISSYLGVIIVLSTVFVPLSIIIIGSAIANISSQIDESAIMITDTKTLIRKILLPLIKPALLSSFILIFIFSISNFAVPAFFGVKVFTTEIFTQFSAFYRHSFAIIQSILLVVICILLLFSERKYIADAPFFSIGSKGVSIRKFESNYFLNSMVLGWIIISILLPLSVLISQSFTNGIQAFVDAFYLLLPTFSYSFFTAIIAAVLIIIIGFTVAYYNVWKSKNTSIFNWLLLLIFTIPSTVYGISLIKFYNHSALNFIYASYAIIIIAYVGKFSFIATKIITNSMKQLPKSLYESAVIQGTSSWSIVFRILLPILWPAFFAAFMLSFIFALGELGITIMVYPPGTEIMPIKVFTIMANAPQAITASMNLIVFSLTLLLIATFSFIAKLFQNKSQYVNN